MQHCTRTMGYRLWEMRMLEYQKDIRECVRLCILPRGGKAMQKVKIDGQMMEGILNAITSRYLFNKKITIFAFTNLAKEVYICLLHQRLIES